RACRMSRYFCVGAISASTSLLCTHSAKYLGDETVTRVLRRLMERYGSGTPQPSTVDFYNELQLVTPASLQYLLADLFAVNTFGELCASDSRATAGLRHSYYLDISWPSRLFCGRSRHLRFIRSPCDAKHSCACYVFLPPFRPGLRRRPDHAHAISDRHVYRQHRSGKSVDRRCHARRRR